MLSPASLAGHKRFEESNSPEVLWLQKKLDLNSEIMVHRVLMLNSCLCDKEAL